MNARPFICAALSAMFLVSWLGIFVPPSGASSSFENYIVNPSSSREQRGVDVAIDSEGRACMVWREYDTGDYMYHIMFSYTRDGGKSISNAVEVGVATASCNPTIAVDCDNQIFIAFTALYDPAYPSDDWAVKKVMIHEDGTITSMYASADSHGDDNNIRYIDIATGGTPGNTKVHIVYMTLSGGLDAIGYRCSSAWATQLLVAPVMSGTTYNSPRIAVWNDNVAVVYVRNGDDVMLNVKTGASFPAEPMMVNDTRSIEPCVAYVDDQIYVAFRYWVMVSSFTYHDIMFRHARFIAGEWVWDDARVVDDCTGATYVNCPTITVMSSGAAYVAWYDGRNDGAYKSEIYYDFTTDYGATFGVDVKVNKDYAGYFDQANPSIASCGSFGPFIGWEDRRGGLYKIFFEDLRNARVFSMTPLRDLDGKALPQYKVNDIVSTSGKETDGDTWTYDGVTSTWTEDVGNPSPYARSGHAIAAINDTDEVLLFGGYNASAMSMSNETWLYSLGNGQWTNLSENSAFWTQTTYADFNPGTRNNVNLEESLGDVMLARSFAAGQVISSSVSWGNAVYYLDYLQVTNGATLTLYNPTGCTIYANSIKVDAGSAISADFISGSTSPSNPVYGASGTGTSSRYGGGGGGGAGYGGTGGNGGTGAISTPYGAGGSIYQANPNTDVLIGCMGANGGSGYPSTGGGTGGPGGGKIVLHARDVEIYGTISADGSSGTSGISGTNGGGGGGGGSGGGIKIVASNVAVSTTTVIRANGGNGGGGGGGSSYGGGGGGGGGGGRIKIFYETLTGTGASIAAANGNGGAGGAASNPGVAGSNGITGEYSTSQQAYISGIPFYSSGTFESSPKNCGIADFQTIYWTETESPPVTTVRLQLRTASTEVGLASKGYVGPDGSALTYYSTTPTGEPIWTGHDGDSWVQYKLYLDSTDSMQSPVLHEVRIQFAALPSARAGHALATIYDHGSVLLFGGTDGMQAFADTWIFDRSANSWTLMSPAISPPARMWHAMSGIYGTDKVLLYGGSYYNEAGGISCYDDTWLYDLSENTWTQVADNAPGQRAMHSMATTGYATTNDRFVVLSGGRSDMALSAGTYVFQYDVISGEGAWSEARISGPCSRIGCAMATVYGKEKVMLYGGMDLDGNNFDDVWIYDRLDNKWYSMGKGPSSRSNHAMACVNGTEKVVLFGGNSSYSYLAFGGEGYLSIVKYCSNRGTLLNRPLSSHNGGANCRINSLAMRGNRLIAGGGSSIQAEVWWVDIADESEGVLESLDRPWLGPSSYSGEITDVCYGNDMGVALMSARHNGNTYLLRVDDQLTSDNPLSHLYPINALCYDGTAGYYAFAYDNALKTNYVYTQDGTTTGALVQISFSSGAMPKGPVNDACAVKVDTATIFTYIASSAYMSSSPTRGLYKMITKEGETDTYSVGEVNVNGDADKPYFNYSSVDITYDSHKQEIIVLAVGSNCYSTFAGGSSNGFMCFVEERFSSGSWQATTSYFETTSKNEFCTTKLLDPSRYDDHFGLIGGKTNSPSVFMLGGSIEADINLTTNVSFAEPLVEDAKITIPGDDPAVTNRMNEQFMPTGSNKLRFHVNVTELNDISLLEQVIFQAWYDDPDGDGVEDPYPSNGSDRNARVEISCVRTGPGTYQFSLLFPTSSEVNFDAGDCQAAEMGSMVRLMFVYAPLKQARYAEKGTFKDGFSSIATWNFQFQCKTAGVLMTPVGGATGGSGDGWEFGIQRMTTLSGIMDRAVNSGKPVSPGFFGMTENFTVAWSSNNDYRMSVEMKSMLTAGGVDISCDNVMVASAFDATPGYPPNKFFPDDNFFGLANYSTFDRTLNKVYWYGNSLAYWDAPNSSYEERFSTNILVYVPLGTMYGNYIATVACILDIDDEPFTPRYIDNEADWTLMGASSSDYCGVHVSSAGDVNGDGFDDVIVGIYGKSSYTGCVRVYYGGPFGLSDTYWEVNGEASFNYLGFSVCCAGDVNGDGFDDIAIGAYGYGGTLGRVYIYHGSGSGLGASADKVLTGASGDNFGLSVSSAGDVNCDGYDDLVVGAGYSGLNRGKAVIYNGSSLGITEAGAITVLGEAGTTGRFGNYVTSGDFNNDGYSDVAVSAFFYSSQAGRVYVYNGSSSGLDVSKVTTLDGPAGSNFGKASSGGDVNGDGYDDLAVGAPYAGTTGLVSVYMGSSSGIVASSPITMAGEAGDHMGSSVSIAGHANADGYADLLIGASEYNSSQGAAGICLWSSNGPLQGGYWMVEGENAGDMYGISVAYAGDVNGDGFEDIIIGAYNYPSGAAQGKVYLYC